MMRDVLYCVLGIGRAVYVLYMCACVSVSVWSLHVWVCQFGHYRDFEVQHDFLPDASSVPPDPASYLTQGFGPGCWTILCKRREAGIYIYCVCVCVCVCVYVFVCSVQE